MSTAKVDRRVEHSHHFSSMEQEHEAGKQGVWLFMATEIMMFGGQRQNKYHANEHQY